MIPLLEIGSESGGGLFIVSGPVSTFISGSLGGSSMVSGCGFISGSLGGTSILSGLVAGSSRDPREGCL